MKIAWMLSFISIFVLADSRPMVFLFDWSWLQVAKECEDFLGPNNFKRVQVSPPNEHAMVWKRPWYERYQPVSFKLESRGGTEEEFISMVKRCDSAGVEVVVDAVINHLAPFDIYGEVKIGSGGSQYSRYKYPNFPGEEFFHRCRGNDQNRIEDWESRFEILYCDLVDLPDLKTSHLKVKEVIRSYLKKLKAIGVAGLRIDAAKHILASELVDLTKGIFDRENIVQEVFNMDDNGPVKSSEYFHVGKVSNLLYGVDLGRIFQHGKLAWLAKFGEPWSYPKSNNAFVFLDNHDTQRWENDPNILTFRKGNLYYLANIFMLTWPYGTPRIMSSFRYEDKDDGAPPIPQHLSPCNTHEFVCEHRHPLVAKLMKKLPKFYLNFVTGWWDNGNNTIAYSRDNRFAVVINNSDSKTFVSADLNLENGIYRNVYTGERVDVRGQLRLSIPKRSATVLVKSF